MHNVAHCSYRLDTTSTSHLAVLSTICKRLNLRQRVVATSAIFFRRFFSKNSYSALDPFLVAATCIYVAAKVEESPIHIKSAVAEAARSCQELGFRAMPTDNSSLAEMEFYLLEEMEFDMIVFHPYRSLIALYDAYGAGKQGGAAGIASIGLGIEAESFGVVKGLSSVEENEAGMGDPGVAKLLEFDEHVLQMSWFVLNDTYKTDIPLIYPPYMVALASLWLALSLHTPSYDRINASLGSMQAKRTQHSLLVSQVLNDATKTAAELPRDEALPPSQEALTFFASLTVSLTLLAEVVQEMVSAYQMQSDVARLVADAPGMVQLLERMKESRRQELLARVRNQTVGAHR